MYDSLGNQDCKVKSSYAGATCPGSGADLLEDWAYDYKSRLASYRSFNGAGGAVNTVSWTNDPLDRPVTETSTQSGSTTNYVFSYVGASDRLASETLSGATSATRKYLYNAFGQRATLTDNSNRYGYLYDPHGSVGLLVDQTGAAKASYGYTAYGSPIAALTKTAAGFDAETNPYGYTAKRLDVASGTLDMGARRYSPATGRFLQYDVFHRARDNLSLSTDPLSANRYALAAGNPVTYIEADGHNVIEGTSNGTSRADWQTCAGAVGSFGCESVARYDLAHEPPGPGCGSACAVAAEWTGISDAQRCAEGSVTGCALAAPAGRVARVARIGGHISVKAVERIVGWFHRGKDAERAAEGASNAADASRLAAQLAREEAGAIFTKSGGLKSSVIRDSARIPSASGNRIGNPDLIADLKALGGSISDWGKYTTPTFKSPAGRFQVQFYYNPITGQAYYGRDYKAVFAGRPR